MKPPFGKCIDDELLNYNENAPVVRVETACPGAPIGITVPAGGSPVTIAIPVGLGTVTINRLNDKPLRIEITIEKEKDVDVKFNAYGEVASVERKEQLVKEQTVKLEQWKQKGQVHKEQTISDLYEKLKFNSETVAKATRDAFDEGRFEKNAGIAVKLNELLLERLCR